jgi:hypothetical protein
MDQITHYICETQLSSVRFIQKRSQNTSACELRARCGSAGYGSQFVIADVHHMEILTTRPAIVASHEPEVPVRMMRRMCWMWNSNLLPDWSP